MIYIKNDRQYEIREVKDIVYDDERRGTDSHSLGIFEVIQTIRENRDRKTKLMINDDFIGRNIESGMICLIQSSRFLHHVGPDKTESGLGYQVFELPTLDLKSYLPF